MGIDILMIFLAGDLNSIVFKSGNSVGMEKNKTLFCRVENSLIHHLRRGQNLDYHFPLGTIFWAIFPVGRVPSESVRRRCP